MDMWRREHASELAPQLDILLARQLAAGLLLAAFEFCEYLTSLCLPRIRWIDDSRAALLLAFRARSP